MVARMYHCSVYCWGWWATHRSVTRKEFFCTSLGPMWNGPACKLVVSLIRDYLITNNLLSSKKVLIFPQWKILWCTYEPIFLLLQHQLWVCFQLDLEFLQACARACIQKTEPVTYKHLILSLWKGLPACRKNWVSPAFQGYYDCSK
jgi:hypothetical protein